MAKQKRKTRRWKNQGTQVKVNRNYKDTVFRKLFSNKRNLLSLYNAISKNDYEDPELLQIVTLENAIYMEMKNDLAFVIHTDLFLFEHQSTYNPNMPLRNLFYISREFQKMTDKKSLYSSVLQTVPAPNFIVLYNGTEKKEAWWIDYLSDAFEHSNVEPNLELKVLTLNINEGYNQELFEQCTILKEYTEYVTRVRTYAKKMPLEDAVNQAVKTCIRDDVLAEFLRKNRAEVIAMSIFEYDKKEEEQKLRKAEYEFGAQNTKKEICRSMVKENIPDAMISKILGVNQATIEKWIAEKEVDKR